MKDAMQENTTGSETQRQHKRDVRLGRMLLTTQNFVKNRRLRTLLDAPIQGSAASATSTTHLHPNQGPNASVNATGTGPGIGTGGGSVHIPIHNHRRVTILGLLRSFEQLQKQVSPMRSRLKVIATQAALDPNLVANLQDITMPKFWVDKTGRDMVVVGSAKNIQRQHQRLTPSQIQIQNQNQNQHQNQNQNQGYNQSQGQGQCQQQMQTRHRRFLLLTQYGKQKIATRSIGV
jgi:hypothetical protein